MFQNTQVYSDYRINFALNNTFPAGNLYGGIIKATFPASYADKLGSSGTEITCSMDPFTI